MRPMRFETWLRDLVTAAADPAVQLVQTNAEAGFTRNPTGLGITLASGGTAVLQIIGRSRDGDKYSEPEQIIEGESALAPVPVPSLPASGPIPTATLEEWLTALMTNAGSPEVATVERYSTADKPGAVRYGATITFHSGAAVFLYVQYTLRPGQAPDPRRAFDVQDEV